MRRIKNITRLLRVKHWVKNVFIFAPLVFSGQLLDPLKFGNSVIAFLGFSLVTSCIYVLNDFLDREEDKLHPKKCGRFFVENEINRKYVFLICGVTLLAGLISCAAINQKVLHAALAYIAINLLYNVFFKFIVLIDVVCVAAGFLIRIWIGAFAVGVEASGWLQVCALLLALLLGFTKRKCEILLLGDLASAHRSSLNRYTTEFLDQLINICAALTIAFYLLYVISPETTRRVGSPMLIYSTVFVIYGIYRYLYLVNVKKLGGDPGELFFLDVPFMVNIWLWISYVVIILYGVSFP